MKKRIQRLLDFAASQQMTVAWLDAQSDAQILSLLQASLTITEAEIDFLKAHKEGLRELLRRDALLRQKGNQELQIVTLLQPTFPDVRIMAWQSGFIVTVDGSDPYDQR